MVREIKKSKITPEKVSDILSKIGYKGTRKLLRLGSGAQGHADLVHDEGLKVWKWFTGNYELPIPNMENVDRVWKNLNENIPDIVAKYYGIHPKYPNTIKIEYLPEKAIDLKEIEFSKRPDKNVRDALNVMRRIDEFNAEIGQRNKIHIFDIIPFEGHNVAYGKDKKMKIFDFLDNSFFKGSENDMRERFKSVLNKIKPASSSTVPLNNSEINALKGMIAKVGNVKNNSLNNKDIDVLKNIIVKVAKHKNIPIKIENTGYIRRIVRPGLGALTSFLLPTESIAPGTRYQHSPLNGERLDMARDWQKYKEHEKVVDEMHKLMWKPILQNIFK